MILILLCVFCSYVRVCVSREQFLLPPRMQRQLLICGGLQELKQSSMVSSLYNICNLCTRVVTNATAKATTTEWFGAAGASSTTKVASKTTTTTSTTASKATSTTTTGSAAEVAPMTTDLACPVGVNGTQWFGPDCRFRCNCATGSSCARSNGECGECREGYSGTLLFVYSSPIRDQRKRFRIGV